MKISEYNSIKIKVLSFIAIMMVLYIHAVFKEADNYPIAYYIQDFFAFSGISIVANPTFFAISGFLFFNNIDNVKSCFPRICKRVKTLLIPYVIWNLIFVLWYIILFIIPGTSSYVNSNIFREIWGNGIIQTFYALFVKPVAFQLWFLRDLLLYVIISPLFYLCIKRIPKVFLSSLFFLGSLAIILLPSEIKIWGAFFFAIGGYIAIHSSLENITHKITKPIIIFTCLFIYLNNALIRPLDIIPLDGLDIIVELSGLIVLWAGYNYTVKTSTKLIKRISELGNYSFFIYLFHEPFFNIIKKIGLKFLGVNEYSLILLYLINPFIMAVSAILVANFLKKLMPNMYSILVGGR